MYYDMYSISQAREIILKYAAIGEGVFFGVINASETDFNGMSDIVVINGEKYPPPQELQDLGERLLDRSGATTVICFPSGSATYKPENSKYNIPHPLAGGVFADRLLWLFIVGV